MQIGLDKSVGKRGKEPHEEEETRSETSNNKTEEAKAVVLLRMHHNKEAATPVDKASRAVAEKNQIQGPKAATGRKEEARNRATDPSEEATGLPATDLRNHKLWIPINTIFSGSINSVTHFNLYKQTI